MQPPPLLLFLYLPQSSFDLSMQNSQQNPLPRRKKHPTKRQMKKILILGSPKDVKLNPIHGGGGFFGHPFKILSRTFKQVQEKINFWQNLISDFLPHPPLEGGTKKMKILRITCTAKVAKPNF